MRTLLFLFCMVALGATAQISSVDFQPQTSIDELINLAREGEKMIFIDFYSNECSGYQYLSQEVFPQQELGKLYNENFVSANVNVDDDSSKSLMERYNISYTPTLLFLNSKGEVLYKLIGAGNARRLAKVAKNLIAQPLTGEVAAVN